MIIFLLNYDNIFIIAMFIVILVIIMIVILAKNKKNGGNETPKHVTCDSVFGKQQYLSIRPSEIGRDKLRQLLLTAPFPYPKYFVSQTKVTAMIENIKKSGEKLMAGEHPLPKYYQPQDKFAGKMLRLDKLRQFPYQDSDAITAVFNDESRMKCFREVEGFTADAPENGWRNPAFIDAVADVVTAKEQEINAENLNSAIYDLSFSYLRGKTFGGKVYTQCSHDSPIFFRLVIEHICEIAAKSPRELWFYDAAAGWGDRLFISCILDLARYVGVDPNLNSRPGFSKFIELFGDKLRHEVIYEGNPGAKLPADATGGKFNIAWLSPPAFDSEKYSEHGQQSTNMFPEFGEWLKSFLFPTIQICWDKLAIGGIFVVESIKAPIINIYTEHYCPGAKFIGTISQLHGKIYKPLWLWQKTGEANLPRSLRRLEELRQIAPFL